MVGVCVVDVDVDGDIGVVDACAVGVIHVVDGSVDVAITVYVVLVLLCLSAVLLLLMLTTWMMSGVSRVFG